VLIRYVWLLVQRWYGKHYANPVGKSIMGQMIFITYNNGRVLQGIVLAFGDRRVRVAVKGSDDAVEFLLINQVWVSEDCEIVKLDFAEHVPPVESEEADLLDSLFRTKLQPASTRRVM
jgi:hypothetical protein